MDLQSFLKCSEQLLLNHGQSVALFSAGFAFFLFLGAFLRMVVALCKAVFAVSLLVIVVKLSAPYLMPLVQDFSKSQLKPYLTQAAEELTANLGTVQLRLQMPEAAKQPDNPNKRLY